MIIPLTKQRCGVKMLAGRWQSKEQMRRLNDYLFYGLASSFVKSLAMDRAKSQVVQHQSELAHRVRDKFREPSGDGSASLTYRVHALAQTTPAPTPDHLLDRWERAFRQPAD
jgi:hypothetical protein